MLFFIIYSFKNLNYLNALGSFTIVADLVTEPFLTDLFQIEDAHRSNHKPALPPFVICIPI